MAKGLEKVSLEWTGQGLGFLGRRGEHETAIDGEERIGPNPVALLLESVAACMAIDVVDILTKGRQPPASLEVELTARRREDPPRYVNGLRLAFDLRGGIDRRRAERAIELSVEKYCSVLHSLRQDLELEWELELGA